MIVSPYLQMAELRSSVATNTALTAAEMAESDTEAMAAAAATRAA